MGLILIALLVIMETSGYNRLEHLKCLHNQRKEQTIRKVDIAIQKLIRSSGKINFNSVAQESGVSKATLYNNDEIKERIILLRYQQSQVPTSGEVKIHMDEESKDAIIASLRRKIKKLEEENTLFKKQVKIDLGEVYKNI